MPVMARRRALAHADSYLVFNCRTCTVGLLGGPQVDYVLSELYEDGMVTQGRGGAFSVSRPYQVEVGMASEVVRYLPLHRDQRLHLHITPDALYRPLLSLEGRTFREMPVTNGKALLKFIGSHEGAFYRTLDDHLVRVHRASRTGPARILGKWKPLSAADFAQSA